MSITLFQLENATDDAERRVIRVISKLPRMEAIFEKMDSNTITKIASRTLSAIPIRMTCRPTKDAMHFTITGEPI